MLRYRRKIGKGSACYAAARDAALNWKLHPRGGALGVELVSDALNDAARNPFGPVVSDKVMAIWNSGRKRLVTMKKMAGPLWVVNPCVVVYELVDAKNRGAMYTSTAYATLEGHFLAGEERVSVVLKDERVYRKGGSLNKVSTEENRNGEVYVEILSVSCPSPGLIGRVIFPFVKKAQDAFFKEEMDTLERIGSSS